METSSDSVIQSFNDAADWLVALVAVVPASAWDAPGLGEWTVRDLVGHVGRALSTVVEYHSSQLGEPELHSPSDYYRNLTLSGPGAAELNASVAERGRLAGAELGDDPVASVTALRDTAVALVNDSDPDSLCSSRGGSMRLRDYLPTRTLELVIHGLDLDRALRNVGVADVPSVPGDALSQTLHLLADVATVRGSVNASALVMAMTGRGGLPQEYSVL